MKKGENAWGCIQYFLNSSSSKGVATPLKPKTILPTHQCFLSVNVAQFRRVKKHDVNRVLILSK